MSHAVRCVDSNPALASELISYAGSSGICIPFTKEANVNGDDSALLVESFAAHESAHYLGIASEDEANFVAYLTCLLSGDDSMIYSGIMLAMVHTVKVLSEVSSEAYGEPWKSYGEEVCRDLDQYDEPLYSHHGEASEAANEMNDNYLLAYGQTSGVRSYGEMLDWLFALSRQAGESKRERVGRYRMRRLRQGYAAGQKTPL